MKNLIFFLCSLLAGQISFSQNQLTIKDLVGTWKIAAFAGKDGQVYADIAKDSLFVSEQMKKEWKSEDESKMVMGIMRVMMAGMKEMELSFGENGSFIEKKAEKTKEGTFTL